MSRTEHFAHSRSGWAREQWHPLDRHLRDTAQAASEASKKWGAGDLAYLAGLWHDLGKYAPDWGDFLLEECTDMHQDPAQVAPRAGARIETFYRRSRTPIRSSPLARGRGLASAWPVHHQHDAGQAQGAADEIESVRTDVIDAPAP